MPFACEWRGTFADAVIFITTKTRPCARKIGGLARAFEKLACQNRICMSTGLTCGPVVGSRNARTQPESIRFASEPKCECNYCSKSRQYWNQQPEPRRDKLLDALFSQNLWKLQ